MSRFSILLFAGSFCLSGCDFGDISVADPPPAPSSAEVVLQVRAEEPEAAAALGWVGGAIPGATVALVPEDTSREERWEGETDAEGQVIFEDVPLGRYTAHVVRPLDLDEFEAAERAIGGFAGRRLVRVDAARAEVEVAALTSRRRGIVLSEYFHGEDHLSGIGSYTKGDFLEIYNNSDTTVYLDRLIIGRGFDIAYDYPPRPCRMFEHLRNDAQGVWARYFHQFPGTGGEYPLAPGELVLIARQAIDHGLYFEGQPDLRSADFEFAGGADNPGVPDLPDVGVAPWPGGLDFRGLAGVPFIAEPEEIDQLPLDREPDSGREYVRFPATGVLEVGSFGLVEPPLDIPLCPELVNRAFDRGYAHLPYQPPGAGHGWAHQRQVLLILPDGREVLQDTDWSLLDLEWAEWTPGALPPAPGA